MPQHRPMPGRAERPRPAWPLAIVVIAACAALPPRPGAAAAASPEAVIVVSIDPEVSSSPAIADGARLGIEEARHAAKLLGREVTFVEAAWPPQADSHPAAAAFVMAAPTARAATIARATPAPVVLVPSDVPSSSTGMYIVAHRPAPEPDPSADEGCGRVTFEAWHASLEKFGAGQLNERFERRYDRPMTGPAWAGWAAIKSVTEAVLRAPSADPSVIAHTLDALRLDGHKGGALAFDGRRRLVHPFYAVASCGDGVRVRPLDP